MGTAGKQRYHDYRKVYEYTIKHGRIAAMRKFKYCSSSIYHIVNKVAKEGCKCSANHAD